MLRFNWDRISDDKFEEQIKDQINGILRTVPQTVLKAIKEQANLPQKSKTKINAKNIIPTNKASVTGATSKNTNNSSKSSFSPLQLLRISPIGDIAVNELEFGSTPPEISISHFATADRELIDIFLETTDIKPIDIPDIKDSNSGVNTDDADDADIDSNDNIPQTNNQSTTGYANNNKVNTQIKNNTNQQHLSSQSHDIDKVPASEPISTKMNRSSAYLNAFNTKSTKNRQGLNSSFLQHSSQASSLNNSSIHNTYNSYGSHNSSQFMDQNATMLDNTLSLNNSFDSSTYLSESLFDINSSDAHDSSALLDKSQVLVANDIPIVRSNIPPTLSGLSPTSNNFNSSTASTSTNGLSLNTTVNKTNGVIQDIRNINKTIGDCLFSLDCNFDSNLMVNASASIQVALPKVNVIQSFVSSIFSLGSKNNQDKEQENDTNSNKKKYSYSEHDDDESSKIMTEQNEVQKKKEKNDDTTKPFISYPVSITISEIALQVTVFVLILTSQNAKAYAKAFMNEQLAKNINKSMRQGEDDEDGEVDEEGEEDEKDDNEDDEIGYQSIDDDKYSDIEKSTDNRGIEDNDDEKQSDSLFGYFSFRPKPDPIDFSYGIQKQKSIQRLQEGNDDTTSAHSQIADMISPTSDSQPSYLGKISKKLGESSDNSTSADSAASIASVTDARLGKELDELDDALPMVFAFICDEDSNPFAGFFVPSESSQRVDVKDEDIYTSTHTPIRANAESGIESDLQKDTLLQFANTMFQGAPAEPGKSPKFQPIQRRNDKDRAFGYQTLDDATDESDVDNHKRVNGDIKYGANLIQKDEVQTYTFKHGILRKLGLALSFGENSIFSLGPVAPLEKFILRKLTTIITKCMFPTVFNIHIPPMLILKNIHKKQPKKITVKATDQKRPTVIPSKATYQNLNDDEKSNKLERHYYVSNSPLPIHKNRRK